MVTEWAAYGRGLGLGASLIVAIGAQNAFVLRQGLKREGRLTVAAICAGCDALLIGLGAAGFGSVIARLPWLTSGALWLGAAFLFWYGFNAFRRALRPEAQTEAAAVPVTRAELVSAALALSLLNPHVYLDTVVLIGGLSAQYAFLPRVWFTLGAMTASLVWFFGLAYGAALLVPLFRRPVTWRVLDTLIGVILWSLALSLVRAA